MNRSLLYLLLSIVGGVVAFPLLAFGLIWVLGAIQLNRSTQTPDPRAFTAEVGLAIPASAANWQALGRGIVGYTYQARFELSPAVVASFTTANNLTPEPARQPDNSLGVAWFPTQPLENYRRGSASDRYAVQVYVERTAADARVYVTASR